MGDIKSFVDELAPFDADKYKGRIGRDYLALYGIWILNKNGFEPLFDYIVVVLHKLFPEAGFSLTKFKEYPDARTVRDTLWHLKDEKKKWIDGNIQSGYILTKRGEFILEKVITHLEEGKTISKKKEGIFYKLSF